MYKTDKQKYWKLTAKLVEEIPWNKLYVYLIGPSKISFEENISIWPKYITNIDYVALLFEITQFNDKKVMTITNLV